LPGERRRPHEDPGFVATYLALTNDATGEYILAGYETTPMGNEYFERYHLLGLAGASDLTVDFGPTGIDPGYAGGDPYTTVAIAPAPPGGFGVGQGWRVTVIPPGREANPFIHVVDHAFFAPTAMHYVQEVWGRSGAAAPLAVFTNNFYEYDPINRYAVFVREDGVNRASGVPAGQWLHQPSQSNNGGAYAVQCC
jgi:hypothetical protein